MSSVVTLEDVQAGLSALQCNVHTAKLARVVAYADATGRATVQLLRRPRDRRGLPILQPPIPSVPVLWIGMGALLGVRGTLQPGNDVLLIVLDRDHSPYFAAPGPFDAKSERMHDQSDVVAIPVTFTLTPVGAPGTIRVGGPAALFGVVRDGGGLAAQLTAQIAVLQAITGVGPDGPNVEAIAASVTLILQALAVSTVLVTE